MKVLGIISMILMLLTNISCNNSENGLCLNEPIYNIHNFEGLEAYSDIEDGINCASQTGKPIFLLFSGYGCAGAPNYEKELFVKKKNRKLIVENYVPVNLYVDDRNELNEEEKRESFASGKRKFIKTYGHKYADYQIRKFESNSQPLIVILDDKGEPILDPIGYQGDEKEYTLYLKKGIKEFYKK